MISILFLGLVFIFITFRQIGNLKIPIWMIMSAGALGVLLTGQIPLAAAVQAINYDVILFLFGMFVVGTALEESGYLGYITAKVFRNAVSIEQVVLIVLVGLGLLSAFLMNDTLAIIGTPLVLQLAKKNKISSKPLLIALAFSVTIGSAMSPLGNPQNLLIAEEGTLGNPFLPFIRYLFIPTLFNLLIAYFVLKLFYKKEFAQSKALTQSIEGDVNDAEIEDPQLTALTKLSLGIIGVLILIKIGLGLSTYSEWLKLTYIALAAAIPILVFSKQRSLILKKLDWTTLIFFAAMFILMRSVWDSNFFQGLITGSGLNLLSLGGILLISAIVSQFVSNVPLVALYMPMLVQAGASSKELLALAAGSTIAGNLTILGAASNVIIIQNAEKRGHTITFWEFSKIGVVVTLLNILVYWMFLSNPFKALLRAVINLF
jgi:Na+/H+ antiporter NhaD/arsenite permease-like protein